MRRRWFIYGLLLLAVFLYAWWEREYIEETHVPIPCEEWQGRGGCLALLADLHARPGDGDYMDEIVRRVLAAKPDAVLLAGDYFNGHSAESSMSADELEEHLRPLTSLPCVAVLGNHDYYYGEAEARAMFARLGIPLAEGRRITIRPGGTELDVAGVRCMYTFPTTGPIAEKRPGTPLLFLSHTPYGALFAPSGAFLAVCGHTHGGQLCLPGGKAIKLPDSITPPVLTRGLHRYNGLPIYTTRGLGTSILPLRTFCRPEITFLNIEPHFPSEAK